MKDLISNERFANALLFVHDKYGYLNRSVIYLERPPKENFETVIYRDKLKEKLLIEHNIQLIRIKYDIPLDDNLTEYLLNIIQ